MIMQRRLRQPIAWRRVAVMMIYLRALIYLSGEREGPSDEGSMPFSEEQKGRSLIEIHCSHSQHKIPPPRSS